MTCGIAIAKSWTSSTRARRDPAAIPAGYGDPAPQAIGDRRNTGRDRGPRTASGAAEAESAATGLVRRVRQGSPFQIAAVLVGQFLGFGVPQPPRQHVAGRCGDPLAEPGAGKHQFGERAQDGHTVRRLCSVGTPSTADQRWIATSESCSVKVARCFLPWRITRVRRTKSRFRPDGLLYRRPTGMSTSQCPSCPRHTRRVWVICQESAGNPLLSSRVRVAVARTKVVSGGGSAPGTMVATT